MQYELQDFGLSCVLQKENVSPRFCYIVLQHQNILFCYVLRTYVESEQSLMADHKQPLICVSLSVKEILSYLQEEFHEHLCIIQFTFKMIP